MMVSKTSSDVDERYDLYGFQMRGRNFCLESSPSSILQLRVKYRNASVPASRHSSRVVLQHHINVAIEVFNSSSKRYTNMKMVIKRATEKGLSDFVWKLGPEVDVAVRHSW